MAALTFQYLIYLKRLAFSGLLLLTFGAAWYILLSIVTMTILWRQRPLNRTQRLTMIFLVASLAINAMYYGFLAKIEAVALMETLIPGGPNDFAPGTPYCSTRAIAARFVLGRLSILLNDAFFMYRAAILFKKHIWMMSPCIVAYIFLVGLTIIAPLRCVPGNLGHSVFLIFDSLTNAFDIISVSLNIVLAAMMSIKLLAAHRLYRGLAAPAGHPGGQYLTVIGLIVESAIAWAFFGILFIVTFMTGMDESIIFRALFEATAGLNPLVLIFRVVYKIHYAKPVAVTGISSRDRLMSSGDIGSSGVMVIKTVDVEKGHL